MYKFANSVATRVSRFAPNDACKKKERRREIERSSLVPSPLRFFIFPARKRSVKDVKDSSRNRYRSLSTFFASMLFFMLFLHPPSHDTTLYSARLINQRNLPDVTSGDKHALCHDPPLYGLFNWHASNQLGGGYRQKKGAAQMHVRGMRRYGICVLDGGYLT